MPRYTVTQAAYGDADAVVLRDEEVGVEARVAPSIGCNVFRYTARVLGQEMDVVQAPDDAETLRGASTGHGIPVMIPYPGRVRNGRFQFGGRTIELPVADGRGHAIHGCVRQRSWKVAGTVSGDDASVTCSIGTVDYPEMLREWPWPIEVTHTTRVQAGALRISLSVANLGDLPMPLGVGMHPYFCTPIGPKGERDRCLVQVEASHWWEQDKAFPTGRIEVPTGALDLRSFRPIGDMPAEASPRGKTVNELYARFGAPSTSPLTGTGIRAAITDPQLGSTIRMTTSDTFRALVLFTPTWTQSASIEPHTCVPDAFNVAASGVECGLMVLDSGQTWRGWAQFDVASTS